MVVIGQESKMCRSGSDLEGRCGIDMYNIVVMKFIFD